MMYIAILKDKNADVFYLKLAESGPEGRFVLMPCHSREDAETLAMGMANLIKFSCGIEIPQNFLGVWS